MTKEPQGAEYQMPSQAWRPLLMVGAVLLIVALLSIQPYSMAQDERRSGGSDTISDVAVMGGIKRTNQSSTFRGGDATAVMGGIDIDLRDAEMERGEAVLDVSSVMGGVKIRVPESWTVVSRVDSIMGGFKDETRHPRNEDYKLVLKGIVMMGGLKVTN